MNLERQRAARFPTNVPWICLAIVLLSAPGQAWHRTLTFAQQSAYESGANRANQHFPSDMKFFQWYQSYAIYGAREALVLLRPVVNTSAVEVFTYNWPIDPMTMDECLQEWDVKEKCYNDVVHVRILPNETQMDVYCTYAHRPMVRSFDLQSMSFVNQYVLTRDPHPPIDSESSYVMLTFGSNIVTAGYQGDYIPTIRATQGKTLLYALRQNSYFVGGFKYQGKAVFGVIETFERHDTNRVSRLVMACANRAEIVRKATLNCSTDLFDQSRAFVFHILTALVDPIETSNGTTLLFATFTTNNSSITASAVCLFVLDKQFYEVFTAPPKHTHRRTPMASNELTELIRSCSPTLPSTIDRDTVESDRQFSSYLSNPLLIETMSAATFTAVTVVQHATDLYCLIIGTSDGRLLSAFTDRTFKTATYEELTLPTHMRHAIRSITYRAVENGSYAVIVTNFRGYLVISLRQCEDKLCFACWTEDCAIRRILPADTSVNERCSPEMLNRSTTINTTDDETRNQSLIIDWPGAHRSTDEPPNNKLLLYIVVPMSFVVFLLSVLIVVLLTKSNRRRRQLHSDDRRSTKHLPSLSIDDSYTYTNNILYRTNPESLFPIKSELSIPPIVHPVYSTSSSHSLPPLASSSSSTPPLLPPAATPHALSVRRLYKSYV